MPSKEELGARGSVTGPRQGILGCALSISIPTSSGLQRGGSGNPPENFEVTPVHMHTFWQSEQGQSPPKKRQAGSVLFPTPKVSPQPADAGAQGSLPDHSLTIW